MDDIIFNRLVRFENLVLHCVWRNTTLYLWSSILKTLTQDTRTAQCTAILICSLLLKDSCYLPRIGWPINTWIFKLIVLNLWILTDIIVVAFESIGYATNSKPWSLLGRMQWIFNWKWKFINECFVRPALGTPSSRFGGFTLPARMET